MHFGQWDDSLHDTPDQVSIRENADSVTLLEFDPASQSGVALGSEGKHYSVTLDSCECGYFISRKRPCKHIYRLAQELGLSEPVPPLDTAAHKAYRATIKERVAEFEKLFYSHAISAQYFKDIKKALESKK